MSWNAVWFLVLAGVVIAAFSTVVTVICRRFVEPKDRRNDVPRMVIGWAVLMALITAAVLAAERDEAKRRLQVEDLTQLIVQGRPLEKWDAWDHFQVGNLYWDKGFRTEARDHFRRAVQLEPRYQKAVDTVTSRPRASRKGDPRGLIYPPKHWSPKHGE
jgi:hypothetical protein